MLKNAPMFKRIETKLKGQGGRGQPMGSFGGGAMAVAGELLSQCKALDWRRGVELELLRRTVAMQCSFGGLAVVHNPCACQCMLVATSVIL